MAERREPPAPLRWRGYEFFWGSQTHLMAIVNATPDSFSGDGIGNDVAGAVNYAVDAVAEGAAMIDVGGESTRPGHIPIAIDEEIARVAPVIRAIAECVTVPISIDTSKAAVAEAALDAGASMINDVRGFRADPDLAAVAAARGVPAILMHDVPPDEHEDLVTSVIRELSRRLDSAVLAGVALNRLIIDPGFGFGKNWRQNLELLRRLPELGVLGRPILVGFSRKSTVGRVLGLAEHDRLEGTLATTALAIAGSADIVRVHDVRPNLRAARMTDAVVRGAPLEPLTWPGSPPI